MLAELDQHDQRDAGVPVLDDVPSDVAAAERRLAELSSLAEALSGEIEVLRRRDVQIQRRLSDIDNEMRLAARLQRDFLPRKLPQVGPLHVDVLFEPAGYVSGDLYDVPRLDEEHVGLYLVDAVGHGTPAALLTMFMKNALRTKVITEDRYRLVPPGSALAGLNDSLLKADLELASFATGIYGHLNTSTLDFTFARGGHPHPMLLRDGRVQELEVDGGLLGIFECETFEQTVVRLQPGDRLIIYSDGVESAFGDGETIDLQHFRDFVDERAGLPADALMASFREVAKQSAGSLEAADDLTILVASVQD
jgi:sigma-B regulation protein RsbU (phosphoserine phosphatase)